MGHTCRLVVSALWTLVAVSGLSSAASVDCVMYLTISPLARSAAESPLQINWGPKCSPPPTWIGLYRQNPTLIDGQPDYYVQTEDKPSGSHTTDVLLGNLQLPATWERDKAVQLTAAPSGRSPVCLQYFIAAYNASNHIQTVDCLKLRPQWMGNLDSMWSAPLRNVFIPGTHCSGCYPNKFSGRTMLLRKFGYSQDYDVWTQLLMGVRHLDLKIGFQTHQGTQRESRDFWAVHEGLFVTPLTEMLRDIRQFVRLTGELVLVDVREFPIGFYNHPERHRALVALIESHLGSLAFGRNDTTDDGIQSGDVAMAEMRGVGRMVLIMYNEASMVKENSFLWTPWTQYSTKSLQPTEYRKYIERAFSQNNLDIISWILTAVQSVESAYTSKGNHLPTSRERAAAVNGNMTVWMNSRWSQSANVVSVDFVWSMNLIDLAIYTNSYKQLHNVFDVMIKHNVYNANNK